MKVPAGWRAICLVAVLVAALLALISCDTIFRPSPSATPTLTATVTLIPSVTPTPTITDTPYPTWTPVPSLTPTATVTQTSTPTLTPTPAWCSSRGLVRTPFPVQDEAGTLMVVYLHAGDLWLWEEGSPTRQLTSHGDVQGIELSTGGRLAAYTRPASPAGSSIWLYDIENGESRLLAGQERLLPLAGDDQALGVSPHHLTWVPGRNRLAFNARPVYSEPRDYVPADLWLLDVPTSQLYNILPGNQGGEFTFSPDGLKVAVARPDRLDIYGSSGEAPRRDALPGYHGVGLGTDNYYPRPYWAGDSRSMRLALPDPETAENPNPEVDLWELPVVGAGQRLLGTIRALPPSVVFSPDLTRAAYLDWPDLTPRIKELGLADLGGEDLLSGVYQPGTNLEFLGWSPDSQHFAFYLPSILGIRLGSLCAPAVNLASQPARLGTFRWADSGRFFYSGGDSSPVRLFLGQVGGQSLEIGPLEGTNDLDYAFIR